MADHVTTPTTHARTRRPLILASASPRRQQLLHEAGVPFVTRPVDVDEAPLPAETPKALVQRLARAKAEAADVGPDDIVLAADTEVAYDGECFGKPRDLADARRMITRLAGTTHRVHTGVCLRHADTAEVWVCTTEVTFKPLTAADIDHYLRVSQPLDKAGAYGIQHHADILLAGYRGSWTNVIGLPIDEVRERLAQHSNL